MDNKLVILPARFNSYLQHRHTGFSADNYAKPIEVTACGHQVLKGRTQTKVNLGGWWVPGPDNPAQYGRHYGDEYLKHVPHVTSSRTAYGVTQPKFPRYYLKILFF